jgi:hypothetical protein
VRHLSQGLADGRHPPPASRPLQSRELEPEISEPAIRAGGRKADAHLYELPADASQDEARRLHAGRHGEELTAMSGFETPENILRRKGSPEELAEAEEALHKLIVPENKKKAIKLEEFSGFYKDSVIARDKEFVERMTKKIAEDSSPEHRIGTMRGELFEAIVNSQIAESDWMGPNADVIVPSRYDDMHNHIDSIIEFEREEGGNAHLALAVDVTESQRAMEEKFQAIRESIEKGVLSQIKYFKSKNFRGEVSSVPRVVVGAGHEIVENVSELLLRFKRLQATVAASHKPGGGSGRPACHKSDRPYEERNCRASPAGHAARRSKSAT